MSKLFAINFTENTIIASKITQKKASVPNSPEYKDLIKVIAKLPALAVVEKKTNINENNRTCNGLTFDVMEAYIPTQSDAKIKIAEYKKVKKWSKYYGYLLPIEHEHLTFTLSHCVSNLQAEFFPFRNIHQTFQRQLQTRFGI